MFYVRCMTSPPQRPTATSTKYRFFAGKARILVARRHWESALSYFDMLVWSYLRQHDHGLTQNRISKNLSLRSVRKHLDALVAVNLVEQQGNRWVAKEPDDGNRGNLGAAEE